MVEDDDGLKKDVGGVVRGEREEKVGRSVDSLPRK